MKSLLLTAAVFMGFTAASLAQNLPGYVPTNGLVGWWPFNGNANDESGNGNNGTVNGANLDSDRFGNPNTSYHFNNAIQGIDVTNNNQINFGNNDLFSIAFWVNVNIASNTNAFLLRKHEIGSWNGYFFSLNNQDPGYCTLPGHINFYVAAGDQGDACINDSINSNQWVFVTGIYDGTANSVKIYLNAALQQDIGNISGNVSNNANLKIGYFSGSLDDIGIWNRALSQQEISDLYNSVTCTNSTAITPQVNSISNGATAVFAASSADPNPTYVWQSDFGQGFQTLNNYGNYSGVNTSSLSISNVQLSEHQQPIRVISTSGNCIDTSNVARISISDTCINSVNDTSFITVTDTLIINISGIGNPVQANTLKAYPNPAAGMLYINTGNFAAMNGYSIRIHSAAGQLVFEGPINQAFMQIPLADFGSAGLYYLRVNDPVGAVVTTRKIVLQQ